MRYLYEREELYNILMEVASEYAQAHGLTEEFRNNISFTQIFEGWTNESETELVGVLNEPEQMELYLKIGKEDWYVFFSRGDIFDLNLSPDYSLGKSKELKDMVLKKLEEQDG